MGFKEAIRETGKGFWFKNGRFFGSQRGSVDQRLTDPYYGDVKVLEHYWDGKLYNGGRWTLLSIEEESKAIDTFSSRINQGTADIGLIITLN